MELVHKLLIRMIPGCMSLVGGLFANHDWPNVQFYRPKTRGLKYLPFWQLVSTSCCSLCDWWVTCWEGIFSVVLPMLCLLQAIDSNSYFEPLVLLFLVPNHHLLSTHIILVAWQQLFYATN